MSRAETRCAAPSVNARNRAESYRNAPANIILIAEPEADLAALYVARRYRLAAPLARAVVALAGLGRAFV